MLKNFKKAAIIGAVTFAATLLSGCAGFKNPFDSDDRDRPQRSQGPVSVYSDGAKAKPTKKIIKRKAALILPTKAGAVGIKAAAKDIRDAALMAYKDVSVKYLDLKIYETDGSVRQAVGAARNALKNRADIILGPMLAPSVKAVGRVVAPSGAPMLAFSSDRTAVEGRNSYLISYLPEQNISYAVDFATRKGYDSFGVFWPETPHGQRSAAVFAEEVSARGGELSSSVSYRLNASDFYLNLQEFAEVERRAESPDGMKSPPSWKAVLLADDARALMRVAPALEREHINLKNYLVMGTGIINEPTAKQVEELDGMIFAAPDPRKVNIFNIKFKRRFKRKPVQIAALGYDAVALTGTLVKNHTDAPFTKANLTARSGFDGASGIFRFNENGLSERGLSVMQLQNGKFEVIAASPSSF